VDGQPAPGVPGALFGPGFSIPRMSESGYVAFSVHLDGTFGDQSIWMGRAGSLTLIARENTPAPGTTSDFQAFREPWLGATGRLGFFAWIQEAAPHAPTTQSLWLWEQGVLTLLDLPDDPAAGELMWEFAAPPGSAGQIAVSSTGLQDNTYRKCIWSGPPGALTRIACEADQAPDEVEGTVFGGSDVGFLHTAINDAGEIAFVATVDPPGAIQWLMLGVWTNRGGPLRRVLRQGLPVPGAPAGTRIAWIDRPQFTLEDEIICPASAVLQFPYATGLWRDWTQTFEHLIARGDAAPDMPAGVNFNGVVPLISVNRSGRCAVVAYVEGPGVTEQNNQGLWLGRPGALSLIARTGEPAPGTPEDTLFGLLYSPEHGVLEDPPRLNDAGQVVFGAALAGPQVDEANQIGFWAVNRSRRVYKVLQLNDPVEIAPGIEPHAFSIDVFPALSRHGEIAMRLYLHDPYHQGVFQATILEVWPDFDVDGDVDLDDFGHLQACMSGSGIRQDDPACRDADLDRDDDVDLVDFGLLQCCYSGPGQPALPGCQDE
jgi:hypothetical protein